MILPTIITVFGSVIVASLTFYFTKRQTISAQWRDEKLNHYKVLLASMSGIADKGTDQEVAQKNFALAVNTIAIVAPQYVISALMEFFDEIRISNSKQTPERHDELLRKLMLAIRKDIGLSKTDDPSTFNFHLISSKPTSYN